MPQTRGTRPARSAVDKKVTKKPTEKLKEQNKIAENQQNQNVKRAAEISPDGKPQRKRTALVDMTNANQKNLDKDAVKKLPSLRVSLQRLEDIQKPVVQEPECEEFFDASDEFPDATNYLTVSELSSSVNDISSSDKSLKDSSLNQDFNDEMPKVPPGVYDFDRDNWLDPYSASPYAMDIFKYLKEREKKFKVGDYIVDQVEVTKGMRAVLVDWMVEVQESFELNHETLYMSVKLTDLYLQKVFNVSKDLLQLVGVTAVFICSKFEERYPPTIEDFLYICDDAYTKNELLAMEGNILRTVDFDIGFSLSYSFLRRYARCHKASMDLLTLARYILETTLLSYDLVSVSDSLLASAAFLLAIKMSKAGGWTQTLEYFSGHKESDLRDLVVRVNDCISKPATKGLKTIYKKYSHEVFYQVAKMSVLKKIEW